MIADIRLPENVIVLEGFDTALTIRQVMEMSVKISQ